MSEPSDTKKRPRNSQKLSVPRKRKLARAWHRWLGLFVTVPLLWLAISGVALNHSDALGLDQHRVTATWVLRHYHQLPEGEPVGMRVGERLVAQWDGMILLDGERLDMQGELVGAVPVGHQLVIASDERLLVIGAADEVVLEHDEISLPPLPIAGLATDQDGVLLVKTPQSWWRFGRDLLQFEKVNGTPKSVSNLPLGPLPEDEKKQLLSRLKDMGFMPLSRVLLDAHSGKLFGSFGRLLNDFAALGIVVLTILGLRLFPKRREGANGRNRTQLNEK